MATDLIVVVSPAVLLLVSLFCSEDESDAVREISFGCFCLYKQEDCSHQTSQLILQ